MLPYTSKQKSTFPAKHHYWLVFLGEERTSGSSQTRV